MSGITKGAELHAYTSVSWFAVRLRGLIYILFLQGPETGLGPKLI